MICKHCKHPIMIAGGLRFHTENGLSHTCNVCGCQLPEEDEDQNGDKT